MTFRHPHLVAMDRVARDRRDFVRAWLPLDIPAFVAQVKALPVFKDCPRSIARTKVEIVYTAFQTGGRAHGDRLARIRVSPSASLAWVISTIVHELVHCALPARTGHNERFRRTLARAARELWGFELDPNPVNERGRVLTYALDHKLDALLDKALGEGLSYPLREVPAEEDVAVRRRAESDARVAQRAAHATRMLARAATRLKRAKTLEQKWRLKVQRYERIAAKKAVRP
jgi:hypothetical protein